MLPHFLLLQQEFRSPSSDVNPGPPEYEEVLNTDPQSHKQLRPDLMPAVFDLINLSCRVCISKVVCKIT
jgi:hypothetical protein